MNIQTTAAHLQHAFSSISGVVDRKSTMPILQNALLRTKNGKLEFIGSDLELQITARTEIEADAAITMEARKALGILKTMPGDTRVSLAADGHRITMKGGKSRFVLQSLPAEDYPLVTEAADFGDPLTLSQKELKRLLQSVAFAMAINDIRYYLNGLLCEVKDGRLNLVATDGHRLAITSAAVEAADQSVIVPAKVIQELIRLLDDTDAPITIRFAHNQVRADLGSIEFVSTLIEGKFPDWRRVIPKSASQVAICDKSALQGAIQRASALADDKHKGIKLKFADGQIAMQSSNANQEESSDAVDCDYTGTPIEIGFNVRYLHDVLANMEQEKVEIKLQDAFSAGMICSPEDENFIYVVMPMRI